MLILIIIIMFLFFFVYPTIGILQGKINIKGKTIYSADTPLTFWSMVGFLYYSGVAFPCIMWRVPHAFFFIPVMIAFAIVLTIFTIFKL